MDNLLKEQLVDAMRRFRKVGMPFPPHLNLSMSELILMSAIDKHTDSPGQPVNISKIQCRIHATKPATSQMLKALEQKGYIQREIDPSDRRKISVRLTPTGDVILAQSRTYSNSVLDEMISRFGEDNAKELVRLLSLLADVSESLRPEDHNPHKTPDKEPDDF